MREALYYEKEGDNIRCTLCPHLCLIKPGKTGSCFSRTHLGGKLISDNFGKVSALHFDPIEKKPLYHFYPGRTIFSVGSTGCNLHCLFCQNSEISQTSVADFPYARDYGPEELVGLAAEKADNIGLAYTYNEPAIWYEFMLEMAMLAHEKGLKNVMVTNGYINTPPLAQLMPYMDAFSVDLKAFTDEFYRKITKARLGPVLDTLKQVRAAGKHLEITNLVISTLNDDEGVFEEMCRWISSELGDETILHLSRYFPTYKMTINATPAQTLVKLLAIAGKHLKYVYAGNISLNGGSDTKCASCQRRVITRMGYHIAISGLDENGKCLHCGSPIAVMQAL